MSKNEEKIKNCGNCNKQLGRIKRYYRDGGYYCNKNCFKTFISKQQKQSSEG